MRLSSQLPPGAYHYADRVALISAALGEPLIPWQYEAAKIATAVHPDRPTEWLYNTVAVTVPRQSGKSTLLRALHLDRVLCPFPDPAAPRRPMILWTTAQKGKDARRRFEDLAARVKASAALKALFHIRASNGSERISFGGVELRVFAPTEDAIHGESTPFVSIDEVWAFPPGRAESLLAAITPAQQKYGGSAQMIAISAAGTRASRWLWQLTKQGRDAVEDPNSRFGYTEYSSDYDDPDHPDALSFHPGVGHIATAEGIRSLYAKAGGRENIVRGFLNRWPDDMDAAVEARNMDAFEAAAERSPGAFTGPTSYAVDVAADRSGAAVYAATPTATGTHIELVQSAPGTAWLAAALHGREPLVCDPAGFTGALLRRARITARETTTAELAAATVLFLSDLEDQRITLAASPLLREQYESAPTRPTHGVGMIWDAARAPGALDHLRAATLAHWLANPSHAAPAIDW